MEVTSYSSIRSVCPDYVPVDERTGSTVEGKHNAIVVRLVMMKSGFHPRTIVATSAPGWPAHP